MHDTRFCKSSQHYSSHTRAARSKLNPKPQTLNPRALLLTLKSRQVLLRAGSIYAALDLLGRHKRGNDFLTHAELASLNVLKVLGSHYALLLFFLHSMLKAPEGWGAQGGERKSERERERARK